MMNRANFPWGRPRAGAASGFGIRLRAVLMILLVLILLGAYLRMRYQNYQSDMAGEATLLAESTEALVHTEHIRILSGGADNGRRPYYDITKGGLVRFAQKSESIRYACLMAARGENIVYLVDSEPASSLNYAPPGTVYEAATQAYWDALETGDTQFVPSVGEGDSVRVLVPVVDAVTGEAIALFLIEYDAQTWQSDLLARMTPDYIVSFSILLIIFTLIGVYMAHRRLKDRSDQLALDEALLHSVFEQAPIGIAVSSDDCVVYEPHRGSPSANRTFEAILGYSREELARLSWKDVAQESDLASYIEGLGRLRSGELLSYTEEKRVQKPDGSTMWINVMLSLMADGMRQEGAYLCLIEDISGRKEMEGALQESERSKAVLLSHLPGMAYRCRMDREWTIEFASEGCFALTGYQPEDLMGSRTLSFNDVIASEYRERLWDEWERVLSLRANFHEEYEIMKKSGERRWVLELGQGIYGAGGEVVALEGIIIDVTDQKTREREVVYLSEHDSPTGLYNRRYLDKAIARLEREDVSPVSALVCDINGVRMVNLAFGNEEGDRLISDVAHIMDSVRREGDLLARTGGDEFTLVMPHTDYEEAARIAWRIQTAIEAYNRAGGRHPYEISLSMGFDETAAGAPIGAAIRTAGESLIHSKLLNQKSSHSALLSSIMATLYARDHETEAHGQRLSRFTHALGEKLGLTAKELDNLKLLSMLHDIGKIGIDDRILTKPAPLTPEEREQMKRHSEIGHRIALSTPELEHIAEYILYHHEKWDGTGYPVGLAGADIPLPARILAVADAFDAMTEDRVYRRAMSSESALAEIARCSGTQFDPAIAELFISLIRENTARGTMG